MVDVPFDLLVVALAEMEITPTTIKISGFSQVVVAFATTRQVVAIAANRCDRANAQLDQAQQVC
ncbi:hypothetical protein M1247_11985 [Mycobacterium sp. 21AC1]|uniref:hypothetical protein n=1 Tax=[Mycobacterium] appelbergii TaxID=2939269 RepID=UPI0029392636|nr:hypothetical protein [Mycobacterium sp. 21AC1]MDV3125636.1 hypothetical protein [Mycobacterium sp. 21AC1]